MLQVLRFLARVAAPSAVSFLAAFLAMPASAQFFFKSHNMTAPPVRGDEPEFGAALPGAKPEEVRAALIWRMRAALNVAALQCQFEPTLLAVPNYNAILFNHKDEFKKSYDTLGKYFARVNKTPKAGQNELDRFGTRTYSYFTTVNAQYGFCQTASEIGARAAFAPRGQFYTIALNETGTLKNSLGFWGEEHFRGRASLRSAVTMPNFDPRCWNKRGEWQARKCGPIGRDFTVAS